eukprot:3324837-Prymnesium_polylepis.1
MSVGSSSGSTCNASVRNNRRRGAGWEPSFEERRAHRRRQGLVVTAAMGHVRRQQDVEVLHHVSGNRVGHV